jgi:hypothetical protein
VQTVGAVNESHVPAQAVPLLATVTTAVLLETKDIGSVMTEPEKVCAVAVKA